MLNIVRKLHNVKGFTLVELMATLAILIIIAVIAVPTINSIITDADDSSRESSKTMIERAASAAALSGMEEDPKAGGYTIPQLVDAGLLDYDYSQEDALRGVVTRDANKAYTYKTVNLIKNSAVGIRVNNNNSAYNPSTTTMGTEYNTVKTTGTIGNRLSTYTNILFYEDTLTVGEYYTDSVEVWSSRAVPLGLWSTPDDQQVLEPNTWTKVSRTRLYEGGMYRVYGLHSSELVHDGVRYRNYQTEVGKVATEWTPHLEDTK